MGWGHLGGLCLLYEERKHFVDVKFAAKDSRESLVWINIKVFCSVELFHGDKCIK